MTEPALLTFGFILDLIIGDPAYLPHPVRGIGWMTEKMEKVLRKSEVRSQKSELKEVRERLFGVLLVVAVVGTTYGVFYSINHLLLTFRFSLLTSYLAFIVLVLLVAATIATRELVRSGQAVLDELKAGDIKSARGKLGMIVGRDTESLDQKGILKATIETLSENASDGIIAPIFYFALGGLPLAMTYKAINTLDSMVGYKNERYKNFGWAAARLDDIANYIPARITGILIAVSSFVINLSLVTCYSSLKTMLRDGRKHSSPNSGIPEAAMAGALGVRLGGPSSYGGVLVEKPYIGEEVEEQCDMYMKASEKAVSLVKITALLGFAFALILLYLRSNVWS